jgi:hypothetical protein
LCKASAFARKDQQAVKSWFRHYLEWLNTHEYGRQEKHHPNNHGVCWSLQAAAYADLGDDEQQLAWIRNQFKTVYLKKMMDINGGFPAELARTKPYGYSLFMIDVMAGVAQIASTSIDNLWFFKLADGRSMQRGMEFIVPYMTHKQQWPFQQDVMHWNDWPAQHISLLFAGIAYNNADYLDVWKSQEPDTNAFEVLRNLPLRHPTLWLSNMNNKGTE